MIENSVVRSGFSKLFERNDSYSFRYKDDWLNYISRHLAYASTRPFANARVMELGAGVHNPLACAISAISMGAASAVAIEPGMIEQGYLGHAVDHAAFLAILDDDRRQIKTLASNFFNANLRKIEVSAAFSNCGIELFGSGILEYHSRKKFDIVHSVAVLEHVFDFENSISHLADLTNPYGIHFHKVDFIDHDYYTMERPEEIDKFKFLFRDALPTNNTCNRIRPSQMIGVFERCGLKFLGFIESWSGEFLPEYRYLLDDQFQSLPSEDLAITSAVMVFEKV